MKDRRRYSFMRTELTDDHWLVYYDWLNADPVRLSERYHCTPKQVEEMMRRIERENPKPKDFESKDETLAKKSPNGDTCEFCELPIVWIDQQPCNPAILKFVTADGKIATGRESHKETCPHANRWQNNTDWQSGAEASQPKEL